MPQLYMVSGVFGKKKTDEYRRQDIAREKFTLCTTGIVSIWRRKTSSKRSESTWVHQDSHSIDNGGAQAYRFENKNDIVIACRGTQPTEFNDIKADLKAVPVMAETVSRVHHGFKVEVDELWPYVSAKLLHTNPGNNESKEIYGSVDIV